MTWETGELELASTIIFVLQANRLTKCASHPLQVNRYTVISHRFISELLYKQAVI